MVLPGRTVLKKDQRYAIPSHLPHQLGDAVVRAHEDGHLVVASDVLNVHRELLARRSLSRARDKDDAAVLDAVLLERLHVEEPLVAVPQPAGAARGTFVRARGRPSRRGRVEEQGSLGVRPPAARAHRVV